MSEVLFETVGITVTVTGIYTAISVVVLLLFMSLWLAGRKKTTGETIFAGQVMNGAGFGLLPALAVMKAFREMNSGAGSKVFEPLPEIRWITVEGFFRPDRFEAAAALAGFIVLCLWLIIRRKDIPDNGDLLIIAVCLWAAIRLVSEDFRAVPYRMYQLASCGTMAVCMIIWCIRRERMIHAPVRTTADLAAAATCIAVNLVTTAGLLSTGSEIGDFAVKTGSTVLMLIITMTVGEEIRKTIQKDPAPEK